MNTDPSALRDLPGAYDVAVCGDDRVPLTDFATLLPRTMFDDVIRVELVVKVAGTITGVMGRNGEFTRLPYITKAVQPGMVVVLRAGTKFD